MAKFSYERQVHYYETDQMGIVHHSNYIRWMEEARICLLAKIGLPYDKMEADGILVPVLTVNCEYRQAFRFGDEFQIVLKPIAFNGVKLQIGYEIYNKQTGDLHARGESGHCFTDKDMKLLRLKKDYAKVYESLKAWSEEKDD